MKDINLLSPENPPENNGTSKSPNAEELISSKKKSHKTLFNVVGLILLLFLTFVFARVFQQHSLDKKQQASIDSNTTSILPKKHKEVEPKKTLAPVKQVKLVKAEKTTPETVKKTLTTQSVIPVEKRVYSLLVGIFPSKKKAEKAIKKIKTLGFKPYQQKFLVEQTTYLVYGGSATDYKSAKKLQRKLQGRGFDTYLSSEKTQVYRVRTGFFTHQNYAQNMVKKLQSKGFKPQIETKQSSIANYEIKLGEFQNYKTAKAQQNKLKDKNIETTLLLEIK